VADRIDHVVAVREGSGITKMSDLVGTKSFYGHPGTSCNANMKSAMVALGLDEQIEEYVGSLSDGVAAMKDRRVKSYTKTTRGEIADATHIDILTTQDLQVITFTKAEVDKIREMYPWITYRQLSPDAFPSMKVVGEGWVNSDNVSTFCHKDLPEEWIYEWVKHIVANWDQIVKLHEASLAKIDPTEYPQWVAATPTDFYLHAGAVRAYRDLGADVPESVIPPELK
jgi:TRAP-type uncharacterized transport system substrate-binding protein